ncbi:hypothetical protein JHD49_04970 [Sulfurimonas sp. SAG-AH-194-C21]|nr:hypothetical protein [Sulfurimonas sp. SAG-AH-194-C21]MDF1883286.1 hypothetical protein [Sulfurimonas sp. SAG-AH-194-C21]
MKKIVLSTIAALTVASLSVHADEIKLYQNANGQVFTSPAADRTALDMKSLSSSKKSITIVDKKSPNFLLGKQTHINMKFVADDNSDMWLKAGVRIQGTFENVSTNYADTTKNDTSIPDAYLRRVRFEVAAGFNKWTSFVMDVRNDKANFSQKGEQKFNVGDAYVKIKKPFNTSLVNFKLYRAKIDVSRTETVKSARVIAYDRPKVADAAAQYISHNRRATNAQMYGDWSKKVHYQVAFGDAVDSSKLADAKGKKDSKVTEQSFFYGGKVRLSPFDGWEETKRTESYFGQGQHFSIGAGYWVVPSIKVENASGTATADLTNKLINLELSAHYKGLFVQAEYFKFDDMVENWNGATINTGTSTGWYATAEYVFTDFHFVAPFVRYEDWNKFDDKAGYDYTATMAGVNWYLKGNSIKAGLVYQTEKYGVNTGNKDVDTVRLTSQFFF